MFPGPTDEVCDYGRAGDFGDHGCSWAGKSPPKLAREIAKGRLGSQERDMWKLLRVRSARPVILTFLRHYLPGYLSGGPVRSVANMVEHLGDEFEFRIVTSDRDACDSSPYPGIRQDDWNSLGKAHVYYASPRSRSLRALTSLIRQTPHDAIYLNSIFDPGFAIAPLLARRMRWVLRRPTLIAPRGEFSQGALQLKRIKKWTYLHAARGLGLYEDLTWQASSELEVSDIERTMPGRARRIEIAPNLAPVSLRSNEGSSAQAPEVTGQGGESLRVVFLSRVSPKKNLDFALTVLAQVGVPVRFDIYGPVDDQNYWEWCRALIRALPAHVVAEYRGPIRHEAVPSTLGRYDLFFLPTRGENYGHAIAEALSAGLPVLIANTTPWRDLEQEGIGWVLPLDEPNMFVDALHRMATLPPAERRAMRARAIAYSRERLTDPQLVVSARRALTRTLNEPQQAR